MRASAGSTRATDKTAVTTNTWLHRFAVFTAFSTLGLIAAGALVTSNDAGLAVPDWPLSYGQLMPPMVGGIFYEHGHRMVATFVGFLTIVLVVWLWRRDPRGWVKKLGIAALAAVIAQGLLGGMTVLLLLPTAISVMHACLAQLFFCMIVSLALFTSPGWQERERSRVAPSDSEGFAALGRLCLAASVAIFAQLAIGAALRHEGLGLAPHLVGAAVAVALVGWVVARVMKRHANQPEIVRWTITLNSVLMLQLVLGAAAYWIRQATVDAPQPLPPMVWLTVAHVAVGALVLAASVILTIQVYSRVAPVGAVHRERVAAAI